MALNKLPNQRRYFYWTLVTWNVSMSHSPSPQIRTLAASMATKLVNHALATQKLLPETAGEALLLVSVSPPDVNLRFLQNEGKKWTTDIEIRRTYIDLLRDSGKFSELREFCKAQIQPGTDDWKLVQGLIDAEIGLFRSDEARAYSSFSIRLM